MPFRARPGHPYVHHTDEEICQGTLKRVYSLGGISFKGSGFYSNEPQ